MSASVLIHKTEKNTNSPRISVRTVSKASKTMFLLLIPLAQCVWQGGYLVLPNHYISRALDKCTGIAFVLAAGPPQNNHPPQSCQSAGYYSAPRELERSLSPGQGDHRLRYTVYIGRNIWCVCVVTHVIAVSHGNLHWHGGLVGLRNLPVIRLVFTGESINGEE